MADDQSLPADDATPVSASGRDYRETVFLPATAFPMRAGLPKLEPELLAKWSDAGLYHAVRKARQDAGAELYVLHDGPPYANGDIHIGHALNKLLKDFVVRSRFALGFDVDYVPGWDCHGLPIEWKIEEEVRKTGKTKADVPVEEFRKRCRDYAVHWMGRQSEQFQRLAVLGDWDHRYATMDFASEAVVVEEFHKILMSGRVYRGSKPVMWSPVERTALADAEVEYHDLNSPMIWVKFPVIGHRTTEVTQLSDRTQIVGTALHSKRTQLDGASVVIWTTTPWTIPANRAISYGRSIAYGLYRVESVGDAQDTQPNAKTGDFLILADKLADEVFKAARVTAWARLESVDPKELICAHPLAQLSAGYNFFVPLLAGDHVTDDAGTGFVHTAPGHGQEDYQVWLASGRRDIPETVDANGVYFDDVPLFGGLAVIEAEGKRAGKFGPANGAVMEKLKEAGTLMASARFDHSYPHSWRSKAPVIYRNTPQWFIAMDPPFPLDGGRVGDGGARAGVEEETPEAPPAADHERRASTPSPSLSPIEGERSLRATALGELDRTAFHPPSAGRRLRGMVETRPDWLVSRQRAWGTPLAIFVDSRTGEPLRDPSVNARIADAVRQGGADAWFTTSAAVFLGPERDPADFEKVDDILDVWFDSGSTHAFTLEGRADSRSPADLYLEGSDQARGWFQSSLLESCATRGHAPYKAVVTHGMTLDENGEKQSKSRGNTTDPLAVVKDSGAEIIRLWVATVDYTEDQRIGKTILQTVTDSYRKLRNTLRYLLGALDGFTEAERVDISEMPPLERFILHRLWELDGQVRRAYAEYRFNDVWRALSTFCADDLSSLYFDIRKDALYCDRPDALRRRACRTVMDALFERLTIWLAPLAAFTCEEAWATRFPDAGPNVLRVFPKTPSGWSNEVEASRWERIQEVLKVVTAALEVERREKRIGSALEAAPEVWIEDQRLRAAFENAGEPADEFAAEVFRTSSAVLKMGKAPAHAFTLSDVDEVAVLAIRAQGRKCQRSWRILDEVGDDARYPDLSLRDADAVAAWDAAHGRAA